MKYKICVAIPIKSANLILNKQIIESVLDKSPDLIEFRFDYINNVNLVTHSFLNELVSIIPPKIPKIFTFRKCISTIIQTICKTSSSCNRNTNNPTSNWCTFNNEIKGENS